MQPLRIKTFINHDFIIYFSSNVVSKSTMLLAQLLLVLFVGTDEIGFLKISQSYLDIAYLLAGLGLANSLLKTNFSQGANRENNAIISFVLISFCSFFLLVFSATFLAKYLVYESYVIYLKMSGLVIIVAVYNLFVVHFQTYQYFRVIAKSIFISKATSFLVFFFLLYAKDKGVDAYIILLYLTHLISISIFLYYFDFKKINLSGLRGKITDYVRVNLKYAAWSSSGNVINLFNKYVGIFAIGLVAFDADDFGNLAKALIFLLVLESVTGIIQQYFTAKLSAKSHSESQWITYFNVIQKRWYLLSSALLISSFFCVSVLAFVLNLIDSSVVYYFIALGFNWLICSYFTLKGPAFISLGLFNINFYINLIALPFILIFTVILVNEFNVWGIVYSKFLYSIIMIVLFKTFWRNRHSYCGENGEP